MIFARLEQVMPDSTLNEPFLFCKKCRTYFPGNPGNYCNCCGHKFGKHNKYPVIITVNVKREMNHKDAVDYVRKNIDWGKGR